METLVGPFSGDSFTVVPLASSTVEVGVLGVVGVPPRPRPRPLPGPRPRPRPLPLSPEGDPGEPGVVAAWSEAASASCSFLERKQSENKNFL